MAETRGPLIGVRLLLLSLVVGAVIAVVSVIAFSNSEQELPFAVSIVVSTISLAALPGYILSAYVSNNVHDANLILAGAMNFILYSGLLLLLLSWRSRRRADRRRRID
jgi:carbon starvation protein CstA